MKCKNSSLFLKILMCPVCLGQVDHFGTGHKFSCEDKQSISVEDPGEKLTFPHTEAMDPVDFGTPLSW